MNAITTISISSFVADVYGPAAAIVLAKRVEQVALGHTAAADDATGPHRLIQLARQRLADAERSAAAASDQTLGDVATLDPRCRAVLENRIATTAALAIAALETIHRIPRQPEQGA